MRKGRNLCRYVFDVRLLLQAWSVGVDGTVRAPVHNLRTGQWLLLAREPNSTRRYPKQQVCVLSLSAGSYCEVGTHSLPPRKSVYAAEPAPYACRLLEGRFEDANS